MECQILFSGKTKKKNTKNLSSAELAQRVVMVKIVLEPTVPVILSLTLYTVTLTLVHGSRPFASPKPMVFRNRGLLFFCKRMDIHL